MTRTNETSQLIDSSIRIIILSLAVTCVSSLVDLEVLGAGEEAVAAREGAHEGLLPGVHPHVVDQLVLGLEGLALPGALLPVARVVRVLGAADVVDGEVVDDVVHGVEHLPAHLPRVRLLPAAHRVHLGRLQWYRSCLKVTHIQCMMTLHF